MRKVSSILFFSFCLLSLAHGQVVWPGDVNDSGTVSGIDVLYWGIAFGAEGPARTEVNTDWAAQTLPPVWGSTLPNGINYAYADCNGDGVVDENDFSDAIEENFGLEHPPQRSETYANASGEAPRLRLTPSSVLVQEGAMVNIGLSFEDSDQLPSSFYGLALKLSYTTGLLEGDDGPDFDLREDSWIEVDDSYVEELYEDEDGMGTAELAITRTNQLGVPGSTDQFGTFSIIIEDIIVGLEVDTFILQIDSVLLIDEHFGVTPVIPDTAQFVIAKDTSKLTATGELAGPQASSVRVTIYPNPTRGMVRINSNVAIEEFTLVDPFGRTVLSEPGSDIKGSYHLSLSYLRPGVYWLYLHTSQGVLTRKLVIAPG